MDMLRLFLSCDADRLAAGDVEMKARLEPIHAACKVCLDETLNTDLSVREDVTEAFTRLFAFLGMKPKVVLELFEAPPILAQAEQSFRQLAIKSGVQISISYPGAGSEGGTGLTRFHQVIT
ncbi:hypothetical protein V0M98_33675 (plasmid) [Pseudomonas silesiensis]|uniref:hypothetical protein n=1 Tax=Pseudomonas silesiensis TaxID=1853130 RepID=UPI0030D0F7C0